MRTAFDFLTRVALKLIYKKKTTIVQKSQRDDEVVVIQLKAASLNLTTLYKQNKNRNKLNFKKKANKTYYNSQVLMLCTLRSS